MAIPISTIRLTLSLLGLKRRGSYPDPAIYHTYKHDPTHPIPARLEKEMIPVGGTAWPLPVRVGTRARARARTRARARVRTRARARVRKLCLIDQRYC